MVSEHSEHNNGKWTECGTESEGEREKEMGLGKNVGC